MAKEFLGSGWRFPLLPDAAGSLGWVSADDNVEQSLRILLMTAVGERVMRDDFGTRAPQLVFAPGSRHYLGQLETTVRDALRDWEPRVDVLDVVAELDPADETRAQVSLSYRVRRSNQRQNLVFPFYLGTVGRR
jgi:phage baseplate assembly protein W